MIMNKTIILGILVGLYGIPSYALPPTLVPINKQTIDLSSYFNTGASIRDVNVQSDVISGYVTGSANGIFILQNGNLSIHNMPSSGGAQFIGFGDNRVYGGDRFVDVTTRSETLLSFANAPTNFTSFSIYSANGNKVYGQYNQSGSMMMPKYFFGTVNNDNTITWQDAPSFDSDGSFYFKGVSGNNAYGSFIANNDNPNYSTKGLLYDLTNGNKTFFDVPQSFGSRIDGISGNKMYGTYEFVVYQDPNNSGPGGRVLEGRGYVYDNGSFSTLAFEDQNSSGGYDFASFSRYTGSNSTTGSFSADSDIVVVSGGSLTTSFTVAQLPEPSALSLLAVGLGGLAVIRRRRS